MAIANKDDQHNVPNPIPQTEAPVIDTASVFHNGEDIAGIISYISGIKTIVDYYGTFVNNEDLITNNNDTQDATLKQYQHVSGMELRLDDNLSFSNDESTGNSTVTGTATVYPFIKPRVGDTLVMAVGPDHSGVFTVNKTTPLTMFEATAWEIEFSMTEYLTDAIQDDLKAKTVVELVYDPNEVNSRYGPLRTVSEHDRNVKRKQKLTSLLIHFMAKYYSGYKEMLFVGPEEDGKYDSHATTFLRKIIPNEVYQLDETIPKPQIYDDKTMYNSTKIYTIWDLLIMRRKDLLPTIVNGMVWMSASRTGANRVHYTLFTAGVDKVAQPLGIKQPDQVVNYGPVTDFVVGDRFLTDDLDSTSDVTEIQLMKWLDGEVVNYSDIVGIVDELLLDVSDISSTNFYNSIAALFLLTICK